MTCYKDNSPDNANSPCRKDTGNLTSFDDIAIIQHLCTPHRAAIIVINTPDRKNPVQSPLGFKSDFSGNWPKIENRNEHDIPGFFRTGTINYYYQRNGVCIV
jgi:hypothetical protein